MRVLLVSDLHYDLRKLDWLLEVGGDHDVVAVAGDLLNIASPVPLDAQITVVVEYLTRLADRTTVVACSGNHDLDHRTADGEKATRWLSEAAGVVTDGQSTTVNGWRITQPWSAESKWTTPWSYQKRWNCELSLEWVESGH